MNTYSTSHLDLNGIAEWFSGDPMEKNIEYIILRFDPL